MNMGSRILSVRCVVDSTLRRDPPISRKTNKCYDEGSDSAISWRSNPFPSRRVQWET